MFDAAIARGTMTRRELIADTGLSKATISRIVEELERLDLLSPVASPSDDIDGGEDEEPAPASRGRRPTALTVPVSAGQVVGVSMGLQSTGVLAVDLAGRELSWATVSTPSHATTGDAVAWLGELIAEARGKTAAPLCRVLVAVPARVVDGTDVPRPPASMSELGGSAFARGLSATIGADVVLDSDANMALDGLTVEGVIPPGALPVLLNMSTVLTMASRRRDGSTAEGYSSSFGDFSLIPFHTDGGDSTIGALLSTSGLQAYCADRGVDLAHISELWAEEEEADEARGAILRVFSDALVSALRMIAVVTDPLLVVLAGRLAPLAERVLPEVTRELGAALEEPPRILVANADTRCHSTSHGAAHTALTHVQLAVRERLASGDRPRG